MFNLKYIILFIIAIGIINADIEDNSANVSVTLSWNGGTTYTSRITKTLGCGIDNNKVYGGASEMWGRSGWTASELNNTNNRLRMNFTEKTALGTVNVDSVKMRIYYTLPVPNPTFINPTPANNTYINATLRVNVSTKIDIIKCLLSHNSTGTWKNTTMIINPNNLSNCYYTLSGRDEGILSGTNFSYYVWTNNSAAQVNSSQIRIAKSRSNISNIILRSPANNSDYTDPGGIILNWSIMDRNNDLSDFWVYGSNNKSKMFSSVLAYEQDTPKGNYSYNWTHSIVDSSSPGLKLLYHFDNRIEYGENNSFIYDFSGNKKNASFQVSSKANFSDNGFFGGAYYLNNSANWINSPIVLNSPMTVSFWGMSNSTSCIGLIFGDMFFAGGNEQKNGIGLYHNDACTTIGIQGNGTQGFTYTPSGYDPKHWNHYVLTSNNSGIRFYLNGIYIGSNTTKSGQLQFTAGLQIGHPPTYPGANLQGYVDEFAIWNRVLSSNEISNLYRLPNSSYYWNITTYKSPTGLNKSETRKFIIHALCDYSWTNVYTIGDAVNCLVNDLLVGGSGEIKIESNITNINRIIGNGSKIAIKNGYRIELKS